MKKITPRKKRKAVRNPKKAKRSASDLAYDQLVQIIIKANFTIVKELGTVRDLRESLAVQTSHVRRLLAEKDLLLGRIADLERAQGTLPATTWDKQAQAWRVVA